MSPPTSSSKVTVVYFDPHGIYPILSPGLLPRLPLRNLHWVSHAGTLRSIASLQVSFAAAATESGLSKPSDNLPSEFTQLGSEGGLRPWPDEARSQESINRRSPSPEPRGRRHQIPGLRQTPYLKVLFVRCDDNDTYKTHVRQQVRAWIKEHTAKAHQGNKKASSQENHDAYEWLIVHVIVPNTAAATQPRTSGKPAETTAGFVSDKSSTARWRGGGSSTIYEKLRADFTTSSKSSVDRIAQIRIGINDVPYDMLPRVIPAIPGSYIEGPQESEKAWLDLVSKLKILILSSFDMRVSQYEEDIREKDRQRALPGWNFCTFFMLKEGLAQGFESVGLVDDALAGYDELAVGLDAIVREKVGRNPSATHGGSFLPFTEDLKQDAQRIRSAMLRDSTARDEDESVLSIAMRGHHRTDEDVDKLPLINPRKQYRELILSNNISLFDFRCYIFTRQIFLLLRLANASASHHVISAQSGEKIDPKIHGAVPSLSVDPENLMILSEVCKRTVAFIPIIAKTMRDDLFASQSTFVEQLSASDSPERPFIIRIVDNITSSFAFAMTEYMIGQTSTEALPIPPVCLDLLGGHAEVEGSQEGYMILKPSTIMHKPLAIDATAATSSKGALEICWSNNFDKTSRPLPKPGLAELAAQRGELYLLSRNILECLAKRQGFCNEWELVLRSEVSAIGLPEPAIARPSGREATNAHTGMSSMLSGISSKLLRTALSDKKSFQRLYEALIDRALRLKVVANHIQSINTCMADLALLKYTLQDYQAAATYLQRVTTFYGEHGWLDTEQALLVLYAKCLRQIGKKEEYITILLKLISRKITTKIESSSDCNKLEQGLESVAKDHGPNFYLSELLKLSKDKAQGISLSLQTLFSHVSIDCSPIYITGQDSFALQLQLQYIMSVTLNVEKARVMVNPVNGESSRVLWLETEGRVVLHKGTNQFQIRSNTIIPGTYTVSQIQLYSSGLILDYSLDDSGAMLRRNTFCQSCVFQIFRPSASLNVELNASKHIHLDRKRSIDIEILTGENEVSQCELHIRAATAGLRLQVSEVKAENGTTDIQQGSKAGVLLLGPIRSATSATLHLPFDVEHEVHEVALKLDITYTTDRGIFSFALHPTIPVMLLLGVNVQDFFKASLLFSKFTISTASARPLRLLSSRLDSSDVFEAQRGTFAQDTVVIFNRQPATMLFRISYLNKSQVFERRAPKDCTAPLSLVLYYVSIEEEIEIALRDSIKRALESTALGEYTSLVVPVIVGVFRKHLSSYDVEQASVIGEWSTSILAGFNWRDYFRGLGMRQNEDVGLLLADCICDWQQKNTAVIFVPTEFDYPSHSITIPVSVPSVSAVHTVAMKMSRTITPPTPSLAFNKLNEPITATLHVKWTRLWDLDRFLGRLPLAQAEDLQYVYEVHGAPDTWLIGGRRKGHFTIPASSETSPRTLRFPLILVPLREGFLPYPNVDIKSVPGLQSSRPKSSPDEENQARQRIISCETDYKNASETIRIVSDAGRTTLSLDAIGPQGGAWLLESQPSTYSGCKVSSASVR